MLSAVVALAFFGLILAGGLGTMWILDRHKSLNVEFDTLATLSAYADGITKTYQGAQALVIGNEAAARVLIAEGDRIINANRSALNRMAASSRSTAKQLVGVELDNHRYHTEIEEILALLAKPDLNVGRRVRRELLRSVDENLAAMDRLNRSVDLAQGELSTFISEGIARTNQQISRVGQWMFAGVLMLALGLGANWLFLSRLITSLQGLYRATIRVTNGDLSQTLVSHRNDEIGAITQSFNAMLSGLKYNIDGRMEAESRSRKQADTLQAIMDNTPFGIWLTDAEGRPIFVNSKLCEEIGLEAPQLLDSEYIGDLFDPQVRDQFSASRGRGLSDDRTLIVFTTIAVPGKGNLDFKVSRVTVHDEQGAIFGFVGIVEDITATQRLHNKISYQATHDPLTGLMNRSAFEEKLEQVCQHISANDTPHALCYFDLDQFKVVNDTCGHHAGDELLRQLTHLYKEQARATEGITGSTGLEPALARLGGDEFALLLYNCTTEDALRVAQRLIDTTQSYRFSHDGNQFSVGCSVGVVPITGNNDGSVEIMKRADGACYVAKEQGRGRSHLSEAGDQDILNRQGAAHWAFRITDAIESDRLVLFAQDITPLDSPEDGDRFEVLVRYRAEDNELIPPGAFIPAAERFSLMPQVDRWVIGHTFAELEALYGRTGTSGNRLASASINLSGQTLGEDWLLDFICEQFAHSTIRPDQVCFEITESAAITHLPTAIGLIDRLRAIGCRFSLDDFGTGLSSFSYLKKLKVDYLKIDGSLIQNIATDPVGREMVLSIYNIARVAGLKTVGEFVTDDTILAILKQIGVDYGQGYEIGMPVPLMSMANVVARR